MTKITQIYHMITGQCIRVMIEKVVKREISIYMKLFQLNNLPETIIGAFFFYYYNFCIVKFSNNAHTSNRKINDIL